MKQIGRIVDKAVVRIAEAAGWLTWVDGRRIQAFLAAGVSEKRREREQALARAESQLQERKERAQADLEKLVADLIAAKRDGDPAAEQAVRQALIDFNAPYPELNEQAEDAAAAAILGNLNEALDDLSEVAERLGPLGEVFRTARQVARRRKKALVLPRLAATASQTLQIFTTLKSAVDNIRQQLQQAGELDDLGDATQALENVLTELGTLRQVLNQVDADASEG